jgi:hypothetical protein
MKVVVNKEEKELSFDYQGRTYEFPLSKFIQVEDDLYEYLKELVPLAFNFAPDMKKTDIATKVKSKPTVSKFQKVVFGKPTKRLQSVDGLPDEGYYGEGLQDDSV